MRTADPVMRFSRIELGDLLKAWIATSLAFTLFFLRGGMLGSATFFGFLLVFAIASVTGGIGFVAHELMHKAAAHRFRVHGEFRSNDPMLVISIVVALLGFLFAAPGAVHLFGHVTRRESGIISAAGPAANMVLALGFLPLALLAAPGSILGAVGQFGMLINAILGAFNLIPVWEFDGAKVIAWSKPAYFAMIAVAVVLVVVSYALLGAF